MRSVWSAWALFFEIVASLKKLAAVIEFFVQFANVNWKQIPFCVTLPHRKTNLRRFRLETKSIKKLFKESDK